MDAYALHLAMAALVGASFVAVSAYYLHRRTLSEFLEFARQMERESGREEKNGSKSQLIKKNDKRRRSTQPISGYYGRASASLPDVTAISGRSPKLDYFYLDEEEEEEHYEEEKMPNGGVPPFPVDDVGNLLIPAGLPRLHTLPEGMQLSDFSPE